MIIRINDQIMINMNHVSEIIKNVINEDITEITFYNGEGLIMHNLRMETYPAERAWEELRMLSNRVYEFKTLESTV